MADKEERETGKKKHTPVWLVVVLVIVALAALGALLEATGNESDREDEAVEASDVQEATEPEDPAGWTATGNATVRHLVKSVDVTDAGAVVMFGPESGMRNITGRVTSASVGGKTYPVGDPAVTYEQLNADGSWASDDALWSVGMWGDEPYDGGIRVTVSGLNADQYDGLTLTMDVTETHESAWDGSNEDLEFTGQTLTISRG